MTTNRTQDAPFDHRRKGILFCPNCGHASVAPGDWTVDNQPDRTIYTCPDCGTTVTTRPSSWTR